MFTGTFLSFTTGTPTGEDKKGEPYLKSYKIRVDNIECVEADDDETVITLVSGKTITLDRATGNAQEFEAAWRDFGVKGDG